MKRRVLLAAGLLALLVQGCSRAPHARPAARVLLVGVDGLEWRVLRPLLSQGRCPNLRSMIERGSFGRLQTMIPTLSPILWTTIATGRTPEEHGVLGFTDKDLSQYTSAQRRNRAVWNIADQYGLTSDVFGWWITWPVEPIRGVMVSSSSSSSNGNWKPAILPGVPHQVHPEALAAEVLAIASRVGAPEEMQRLAREKVFGDIPEAALGAVERRLIQQTMWSIQSDATISAIASALMRAHPADLSLVYLGGPDVVGHRFWRYYEPAAFHWPGDPATIAPAKKMAGANTGAGSGTVSGAKSGAESGAESGTAGARLLARAIPNYYEWADEMIGALAAAAGPGTVVIVCSDHGMHAFWTEAPRPHRLSGHHLDGPPGVIIAAGPGIVHQGGVDALIAGDDPPVLGSVLSVTPTLLALLGIPPSREMRSPAMANMLQAASRKNAGFPPVETHDAGFRPATRVEPPAEMNELFLERFRQLGYIAPGKDANVPPPPETPGAPITSGKPKTPDKPKTSKQPKTP